MGWFVKACFFTWDESTITPLLVVTFFLVFSMSERSTPRLQSSIRMVLYPIASASAAVAPVYTRVHK